MSGWWWVVSYAVTVFLVGWLLAEVIELRRRAAIHIKMLQLNRESIDSHQERIDALFRVVDGVLSREQDDLEDLM